MQLYLPIAELTVNVFVYLGLGAVVGFVSGLFGVGGGFLLTPLLIFTGIPPAVAVASVTPQIVASSTSGAIAYWRRGGVDATLNWVLLAGGALGTALGVYVFRALRVFGQLDLLIGLAYVTFLGTVGGLMLRESLAAMVRARRGDPSGRRPGQHHLWVHGLPLKLRFRRSKLYVSVIPVVALGFVIGFVGTVLGIGGGFLLVPALIYLLRVPSNLVVGTSLAFVVATMAMATILHAVANKSVDLLLAVVLMAGGVVGAQFGVQFGQRLRGEQLRALLALLVLAVAARFLVGLFLPPEHLYSVTTVTLGPIL